MKKRMITLLMCLTLGTTMNINAIDWGSILGTTITGIAAYKTLDEEVKKMNDTEEGRQGYFQEMKKQDGVCDDEYHKEMLDNIMERLSVGVAAYDDSIKEKPFLYFLNGKEYFNAGCGLGRCISVNKGLFSISESTDEIAFVLAHEMGHGMKNHTLNGTMKKARTIVGAAILTDAAGGGIAPNLLANALVGQINNIKITKKSEWEADNLAMDYAYAAGYNPGAGAALWQRVLEKQGEYKNNLIGEIFSPNDHPKHEQRRDNYEKRLTEISENHVTIKKGTDTVEINKKEFTTPAPLADMTSAERKYFLMGNLAAAYDHGDAKKQAKNVNGTIYLGEQAIMTPVDGDEKADELVKKLNKIK